MIYSVSVSLYYSISEYSRFLGFYLQYQEKEIPSLVALSFWISDPKAFLVCNFLKVNWHTLKLKFSSTPHVGRKLLLKPL